MLQHQPRAQANPGLRQSWQRRGRQENSWRGLVVCGGDWDGCPVPGAVGDGLEGVLGRRAAATLSNFPLFPNP